MRIKKYGRRRGVQRYRCLDCSRLFQSERRPEKLREKLWNAYVSGKQTLKQLAGAAKRSHVWVRGKLDAVSVSVPNLVPQETVLIVDTTFWGRAYGVCVFFSRELKRAIWWHEVESERMAHYHYGRKILETAGWTFSAVVVDGRRGFLNVFKDIPVQMCQFHQMKQVTKYLTRRPKTDAGKELRELTLTLPDTDEETFTNTLNKWHATWGDFIEEDDRNIHHGKNEVVLHAQEGAQRVPFPQTQPPVLVHVSKVPRAQHPQHHQLARRVILCAQEKTCRPSRTST